MHFIAYLQDQINAQFDFFFYFGYHLRIHLLIISVLLYLFFSFLPSFVLSSKLCFYWRPLWIAWQNVIRQAVDESILSFNDQPTWCAFYMAPYTFKGNQWKANNAGSLWAACLMAGCAWRLFVNMHGSVVCRVALYCIRLNECDCKGGSLWDKEWLTYESTILVLHSHTCTGFIRQEWMEERERKVEMAK